MSTRITNNFVGGSDAYLKTLTGQSAEFQSGYAVGNQSTYEQRAGLRADLIASGHMPTILSGKDFIDQSQAIDIFDRTNTSFLNSLGSFGHPNIKNIKDMEFTYPVLDIDTLQWTSNKPVKEVVQEGSTGNFVYGKGLSGTPSTASRAANDQPLLKMTNLIPETDKMFYKLRHNMIIQSADPLTREHILVQKGNDGVLYGLRGSHISGLIDSFSTTANATKLPVKVTQEVAAGKVWLCVGQVMSELEEGGEHYRYGYDFRHNFVQIFDFMTGEGWLEKVLSAEVNGNRALGDSAAYAKERALKDMNQMLNNAAIHSQMRRWKNANGETRFSTMGILQAIKLYCTKTYGGTDLNFDGWFEQQADNHTDASAFNNYKCNGQSNFKFGKEDNPLEAEIFSKETFDKLDLKMRENVGLGANHEDMLPNVCYMPTSFYGIATQFDKDRARDHDPINTTSGYLATNYITPQGTRYHFIREDNLKNEILLGNPANGGRKPVASLLQYDFPLTPNRAKQSQYISIQGFQWKRPELLWAYWGNLHT